MKTSKSEIQWLALGARTESEQAHEWPAVMAVILNRCADRRWPDAVFEVLLEPLQFSGFNGAYGDADDRYAQVRGKYPENQMLAAEACAQWILGVQRKLRAVDERVFWFYSPRSMTPPGKVPSWAAGKRRVLAPGVEPWRFIFLGE